MHGEMGGMQRSAMTLSHGLIYPADILADSGTDTWVIGLVIKESSLERQALQRYLCTGPQVTAAGNGLGVGDARTQHVLSQQVLVNPLTGLLGGDKPDNHAHELR